MAEHPGADERPVLVVYASRLGTTERIAARIAERIAASGLPVELSHVADAGPVEDARAVVFGSAVYDGRWAAEGDAFVRAHVAALAGRPTWLFSVGASGDTGRLTGRLVRMEPRGIGRVQSIVGARDYRVFAGRVHPRQWPWYGRLLHRLAGGHYGDLRDWPVIDAWADGIAAELGRARVEG